MRNTKKVISILLTLLMVVGMMSTFAFADTKASITIDNAISGTEYNAYKIMDATFVAGSNPVNGSYTISSENQFYKAISAKTELFTLTKNTQGTYNVTPKDGITAKEIADWLKSIIDVEASLYEADDTKTASTGTVTLEVEKDGFYYVSTGIGSICTTFNTTKTTIHDKNTKTPGQGEKTVDNGKTATSAQVGDVVPFELTVNATNYKVNGETSEKITKYTITDTMTGSMVLNALPTVSYTNFADDAIKPTPVFKNATTNEVITSVNPSDEIKSFIVEIDWSTVTDGKDHVIKVNYNALITGADSNITNKAEFKSNDETINETPDIPVYVYNFSLKKTDKESNPLTGAKFKLYTTAAGVEAIKFNVEGDKEKGFVYTVATNGTTDVIDMTEVSNVKINGLKNGTYYVEEIVAPDGYNKLDERKSIEFNYYVEKDGEMTTNAKAQDTQKELAIVNYTGTELPSTGGIGTTIFYLIGAILVIGAGVVFVTRRRMHSEK